MATTIGNLAVILSLNQKGFGKALTKAGRGVVDFGASVVRTVGKITALGGAITALAAGAGLGYLTRQAFESIDATAKWSDKLGIAIEKLMGLQYAADLSGVSTEKLRMGLQRMTRRISDAARGSGAAVNAIRELGLDAQRLAAMSPDQQFRAIAEAMQDVGSQSDRVRLAFKLFDSEGVDLVNTMRGGAEALDAMQQEAERLGVAFSRVDAAKVEMANDAISRMRAVFRGLAQTIAIQLAPFITAVANRIAELGAEGLNGGQLVMRGFEIAALAIAKTGNVVLWLQTQFKAMQLAATFVAMKIVEAFFDMQRFVLRIIRDVAARSAEMLQAVPRIGGALAAPLAHVSRLMAMSRVGMARVQAEALDPFAETVARLEKELVALERMDYADGVSSFFARLQEDAQAAAEAIAEAGKAQDGLADGLQDDPMSLRTGRDADFEQVSLSRFNAGAGRDQAPKAKQVDETNALLTRIVENTRTRVAIAG